MTTKAEQAELIDELTSKLQETEIALASSSITNKHETAQAVVNTHIIAGMSLGLLPIPLLDIAALMGTQLNMLRSLCKHYEVDFSEKRAKSLLHSLTIGALPALSVMGLSSVVKAIPGVGSIIGGVSVSVLSGATVYASGQVFISHFEAGGTLNDFDSKQWKQYFNESFEEGKVYTKGLYNKSKSSLGNGYEDSKSYLTSIKNKFSKPKQDCDADDSTAVEETKTENAEDTVKAQAA
jgi:uncharacterized protein (DUF697 family)